MVVFTKPQGLYTRDDVLALANALDERSASLAGLADALRKGP